MVFAAPLIGFAVGDIAEEISTSAPKGFAGIPRVHFLWFWLLVNAYALGLIAPIMRLFDGPFDEYRSLVAAFVQRGLLIPVLIYAIPLYFALRLLSGSSANTWHPAFRQIAGIALLIGGLVIGIGFDLARFALMSE